MEFIEKLDYLMHNNKMNKSSLSKETGIPYTTIDGFYKKGADNIKLSNLKKISEYFGVSLDYLVDDDIPTDYYERQKAAMGLSKFNLEEFLKEADEFNTNNVDFYNNNTDEYLNGYPDYVMINCISGSITYNVVIRELFFNMLSLNNDDLELVKLIIYRLLKKNEVDNE